MSDLSPRQLDALARVERKPELQPFFLRRLRGLRWFDELASRGFFDARHNPEPVETGENLFMVPAWPILEYLDKTAPELLQADNRNYSKRFMSVIRDVTADSRSRGVSNYRTWWYFANTLCFIHVDDIQPTDFELVGYWLQDPFDRDLAGRRLGEKLLPRFLDAETDHSRALAVCLLEALTEIRWLSDPDGLDSDSPARRRDGVLPIDSYHAVKIFEAHARTIGQRLGVEGLRVLHSRLSEVLLRTRRGAYSAIWRPAIEEHEQNISRQYADGILIGAYRDALLGHVDRLATAASGYIQTLIEDEEEVFQRLAIFVASQFHDALADVSRRALTDVFFTPGCRHETYQLLSASFPKMGVEEKERVLAVIGEVSRAYADTDQPVEVQERQRSYEALRWLSAVRDQGYPRVEELYAEHLAIAGSEPEHPDFSSYMTGGAVAEQSEYSAQDLLGRDFDDLVRILDTYVEPPGWREPTRRGLALELKSAIVSSPATFRGRLSELSSLDFDFVCEVLQAYKDLWSTQAYDSWAELLDFCAALRQRDGFWGPIDRSDLGRLVADRGWVVGSIADLIRAGTTTDDKSFSPDLLDRAGEIIAVMLEHQEGSSLSEGSDPVTFAINSPRGKCVEALVNYALRRCRLADSATQSHQTEWEEKLSPLFDREIRVCEAGNYEFVTLFGFYILNFLYLNQRWTIEQLPRIFDKSNRQKWLCAMDGYAHVNRIHPDIYRFLRSGGHLIDVLDASDFGQTEKGRIVENIVVAYMRGDEDPEDPDSPLHALLYRRRYEELHHLVWFIWTMRKGDRPDFEEKILPLWIRISGEAEAPDESQRRVLSSLCMWVGFLEVLEGKAAELVMEAAPFADLEHNGHTMVTELRRLVERAPVPVADIYLRMLSVFAPSYPQEDVEATLEALFQAGDESRTKANSICDRYIEHGVEFPAHIRARFARS